MDLSNPLIAYAAVFVAGLISSISPCVLIVIPIVISYVGGYAEGDLKKAFVYSLFFSVGVAVTLTLLGAVASLLGTLVGDIGGYWKYILSALAIIIGLQAMRVLPFQIPSLPLMKVGWGGLLGALLCGMLFAVASAPCATPILALILTYVASKNNLLYGTSLLLVYSLAHTAVIFLVGISTGMAEAVLKAKKIGGISEYFHIASGLLFILFGVLMLFYMP